MVGRVEFDEGEYKRREREASDFWSDYVYSARSGAEKRLDVPEAMDSALKEVFGKIDAAVARAVETGYIFFQYRSRYEHPAVTTLIFSDGKAKKFQRTLTVDERFTINGQSLHFHDFWWLRVVFTSIILSEGKVKPDPRGDWIPDEIIENADKLQSEFVANKKTGETHLKVSIDQSNAK